MIDPLVNEALSCGAAAVHLRLSSVINNPGQTGEIYFTHGADRVGSHYDDLERTRLTQDWILTFRGTDRDRVPEDFSDAFTRHIGGHTYNVRLSRQPPWRTFHLMLEIQRIEEPK